MEENVYLEESEEQGAILDEVMTVLAVISEEFGDQLDPMNLPLDVPTRELFFDNVYIFGLAMAKIHLFFGIEISYKPSTEFEVFPKLDDAFQYFGEYVLRDRGLWQNN